MGSIHAPHRTELIDPFGTPEYLCNGIHRELIGGEIVRAWFWSYEDGQRIVRAKTLYLRSDWEREKIAMLAFCYANRMDAPAIN